MLRSSKTGVVSAALIIGVLSGCAQIEDEYDNLMGISRTTPESSDVNFNNRHAPVLNNVISGGAASDTSGERDIYAPQSAGRRVPIENNVPASDNTVGGGVKEPAITSAPVAPVMAASVPAAANPPAMTLSVPVPVNSPAVAASDTPYPSLATVPPMPPTTPKAQSTAEFNALTADRNLSEAGRKQLMSDPSATVMTSPQTGQMVDNAADAVAPQVVTPPIILAQPMPTPALAPAPAPVQQATKEDGGFNNWLHHLFPSDNQSVAAPAGTVAKETPSENPVPAVASGSAPSQTPHDLMAPAISAEPLADVSAQASVPAVSPAPAEVIHLTPPAPAVAADAAAQPAATEMEPVHLHPPASMAASDQPADQSPPAASEEPIALVPPLASSQTHYLADSRYAARRMQVPADDNNNSD